MRLFSIGDDLVISVISEMTAGSCAAAAELLRDVGAIVNLDGCDRSVAITCAVDRLWSFGCGAPRCYHVAIRQGADGRPAPC